MQTEIANGMKIEGSVEVQILDKDYNVKEVRTFHNLVTNAGINNILLSTLLGNTHTITGIAIGTGTGTAAATDTAMVATAKVEPLQGSTLTNDNNAHFAAFVGFNDISGTISITELGLMADTSVLFSHLFPTAIAKTPADALVITWNLTVTAS